MADRPDPAALDAMSSTCACFTLRRAARAVTQLYDRALAPLGLRATQVSLLVALERAGAVPFTKLAAVLGMDRTTLTRNVGPLERDGMIALEPGPDRRVKLVSITAKGRRKLAAAVPLWEAAQRRITSGIGDARWDDVSTEIRRLTALAGGEAE